jgi:hypothetical protein
MNPLRAIQNWRAARAIARSTLFDREWYLKKYPDVAESGLDPIRHYVAFGAREGRDPSPEFSTRGYLSSNPHVVAPSVNPLWHFIRYGAVVSKQPCTSNRGHSQLSKRLRTHYRKSPTVFQGFWHGPALGWLLEACLRSFIRQGHVFELYTYEDVIVPEGVILRNAAEIIPLAEVFYYDNPQTGRKDISPFSDLFRFKFLSERGGWWSDVDTVCLSADIPVVQRAWAQELPEVDPRIGTSQIAIGKGDPLALELYSRCLGLIRTGSFTRESTGANLISATIPEMQLPLNSFGSADLFYPIRWIEMFKLWLPDYRSEVYARCRRSLFLPIYHSFSQYIGVKSGKLPPDGSFLADICKTYLQHDGTTGRYSEEEVVEGTKAFFRRNANWAIDELITVAGEATAVKLGLDKSAL